MNYQRVMTEAAYPRRFCGFIIKVFQSCRQKTLEDIGWVRKITKGCFIKKAEVRATALLLQGRALPEGIPKTDAVGPQRVLPPPREVEELHGHAGNCNDGGDDDADGADDAFDEEADDDAVEEEEENEEEDADD
eukprot:9476084-Pyramimonas_sp.AAC.1